MILDHVWVNLGPLRELLASFGGRFGIVLTTSGHVREDKRGDFGIIFGLFVYSGSF